jgi:hypothetical protein
MFKLNKILQDRQNELSKLEQKYINDTKSANSIKSKLIITDTIPEDIEKEGKNACKKASIQAKDSLTAKNEMKDKMNKIINHCIDSLEKM